MKHLFSIACLFLSLSAAAQGYIIADTGGDTNIYEDPDDKSEIIDKVDRYEVFRLAAEVCSYSHIELSKIPAGWLAVNKFTGGPVGYMKQKNVLSLDSLPSLWGDREEAENFMLRASDGQLTVDLLTEPVNERRNKLVFHYEGGFRYLISIDGRAPLCSIYGMNAENTDYTFAEIMSLKITENGKTRTIPATKEVKPMIDPHTMIVYRGKGGEFYISVFCGDPGESARICITVMDGEIKNVADITPC